ncbi:MAG: hypothetical protein ABJD07_05210 [Gemmatimonadaceae bacterium]
MTTDPHMLMTPLRSAAPGDSARAAAVVAEARRALAKYKDVRVAEADGFRQFLPNVMQPVYHFTSYKNGFQEAFRFDAAKPTSLLYRKNADGSFTLEGAMYTYRQNAPPDDLDKRIPLSIARWHEHVNWCVPSKGDAGRWTETEHGKPLFGPQSPIATREQCRAVNGDFHEFVLGWMVHANIFAGDDPREIWGTEHHHEH